MIKYSSIAGEILEKLSVPYGAPGDMRCVSIYTYSRSIAYRMASSGPETLATLLGGFINRATLTPSVTFDAANLSNQREFVIEIISNFLAAMSSSDVTYAAGLLGRCHGWVNNSKTFELEVTGIAGTPEELTACFQNTPELLFLGLLAQTTNTYVLNCVRRYAATKIPA